MILLLMILIILKIVLICLLINLILFLKNKDIRSCFSNFHILKEFKEKFYK
ncbi:hypothetical protein CURT_0805 [Campylobacter ureolyticus]|uniref:Uncharacterized protein n=1 Tax=Campylobacter ureolyticus TaxID=827 RepID=A0AAE7JPE4_9BACT|nr:hypothetical protein CURT_0805 [Campylobacter ureolyticus]